VAFIVGRAIAGLGAGGIQSGVVSILAPLASYFLLLSSTLLTQYIRSS
jgi:hypothetical protein